MDDPFIIQKATFILIELSIKPREQIHFSSEAIEVLPTLEHRGLISCHRMSTLPEQNIWVITHEGLRWLNQHGLLPKGPIPK